MAGVCKLPVVPILQQRAGAAQPSFPRLRKSRYREVMIPGWFLAALAPMIASQIIRLHQHDPGAWIFWDYAGRLCGLAVLATIPAARAVAFRPGERRLPLWKIALWVIGLVLACAYLAGLAKVVNAAFPMTVLGYYPRTRGWLHPVDLVFGLALVAFSEEIVFRRCARHVFQPRLGDGWLLVLATSLLFGGYHWWTGLGQIIEVSITGALFMLFYRRSGALWPVVLAHYLTDLYFFG
jgi:membrane protease YdiL (CAAX protease family)